MISKTAEYALRAIVFLSEKFDEPCTTAQIAEATHVPAGYLSKVMQSLSRGGVVSSQRGLNGGFKLAKAPSEMTVLDVVQAVDPVQRIHECPLGLRQHDQELCALHRRLDEAAAFLEGSFRDTSIGELLAEKPILTGV